jgi:hypothetical protein
MPPSSARGLSKKDHSITERAPHDPLEVLARKPLHLFGEDRYALAIKYGTDHVFRADRNRGLSPITMQTGRR